MKLLLISVDLGPGDDEPAEGATIHLLLVWLNIGELLVFMNRYPFHTFKQNPEVHSNHSLRYVESNPEAT